jgi:hypothetical protein
MSCTRIGMLLTVVCLGSSYLLAQVPNAAPQPVAQTALPAPILIKKTIVFLETDCLHDFTKDAANLQRDTVLQMKADQRQKVLDQLSMFALRLQMVKQRLRVQLPKDKDLVELTPDERNRFAAIANPNATSQQNADEIEWRFQTLVRLMKFTDEEIAALSDVDLPLIVMDQVRGTGFLVGYPDPRITRKPGEVEARMWPYLVTNRHVIQPGIEHGAPCKIVRSTILVNRKPDAAHPGAYSESARLDPSKWTISPDDAVDVAVTRVGLDETKYDHVLVPTTQFVSDDEVKSHKVVEGDPVLFAGLFVQTFNQVHTLEPIVRSGSLAMIPEAPLQMTLNGKPGHVYLAEAHAFHGNSGSPVFIDLGKFAGIVVGGPYLKLLGLISQEVSENSDLTLTVATTVSGSVEGNSGVSVVVPVSEIVKLLDDPALTADRDFQIQRQSNPIPH